VPQGDNPIAVTKYYYYNNPFVCKSENVVLEAKNIYKLLCIMANVCKMGAVYMRMNQYLQYEG
jgi:hypothetical protein